MPPVLRSAALERKILVALAFHAAGLIKPLLETVKKTIYKALSQTFIKPVVINKYIAFPFKWCKLDMEQVTRVFYCKYKKPILGCINGTHVAILLPTDHEELLLIEMEKSGYPLKSNMITPLTPSS